MSEQEGNKLAGFRNQKFFWAIVNSKGQLILDQGRLPIFWMKKIAKQESDKWGGSKVIKIFIFKTQ